MKNTNLFNFVCKKIFALSTAMLTVFALVLTLVPVLADNVAPTENLTFSFDKYLVMDVNANVPNANFKFTIAPKTDNLPAGVYSGKALPDDKKTVDVSFAYGDSTVNGLPTDSAEATPTSGKKYATKTVTFDFTGLFTDPGVYRYVITETNSAQDGITYDTSRVLDVYVTYDESITDKDQLEILGYRLYKYNALGELEVDKSDSFTNEYTTNDLTLTKEVTGNQGNRYKYFEFTVLISNAVAGTVYDVTLPTSNSHGSNPQSLTAVDGTVNATFYLRKGQSITINGLTPNTKYQITETDYSNEGYSTTYKVDTDDEVSALSTLEGATMNTDHTVVFTNSKSGSVPTGIIIDLAPYLVLVGIVIVAIMTMVATKKRRSH